MLENMLSTLEPDFQSRIRYEASVLNEFKKLLVAPEGSLNLEELTNVIPLHLLLTYLVHQIEVPQIPSLPDFLRRSKSEYLESEAVPLWEEKPKAMENLKANVMRLADTFKLVSSQSRSIAFIIAKSR